jgi:branched-chain amino acid transport system ATP-binding protein
MRSILGLTPPRAGTIRIAGQNITGLPAYRVARLGVGYVPEGRRMFKDLTTLENLQLAENGRGGDWTIARVLEHLPKLAELRSRKSGRLSGGEQEMLSIGRALVSNPRLLLVDEPSQGLAPLVVEEVYRILSELKKTGVAILLVEQNALLALKIEDRAYVLDSGRIVHGGPAAELAADQNRIRTLMGLEVAAR